MPVDIAITSLPPAVSVLSTDIIPMISDPSGSPAARVTTVALLLAAGAGANSCAAGDPEGIITAGMGATYLNSTNDSYWFKKMGTGNTGWIKLIG